MKDIFHCFIIYLEKSTPRDSVGYSNDNFVHCFQCVTLSGEFIVNPVTAKRPRPVSAKQTPPPPYLTAGMRYLC